tara:strand:+ start:352 stop:774 length:423 start_codon:yes stop_codon:yes gene_type:complete
MDYKNFLKEQLEENKSKFKSNDEAFQFFYEKKYQLLYVKENSHKNYNIYCFFKIINGKLMISFLYDEFNLFIKNYSFYIKDIIEFTVYNSEFVILLKDKENQIVMDRTNHKEHNTVHDSGFLLQQAIFDYYKNNNKVSNL